MSSDVRTRVLIVLTRAINTSTLALLSRERQCWGAALVGEQAYIDDPVERLAWAAGGIRMTLQDFTRRLLRDPLVIAAVVVFGVIAAVTDLHSTTRWPHVILLFSLAVVFACWRPRWAWRWAVLLTVTLPAVVVLTGDWGPYAVDQFDVFYGIVPAIVGTLLGAVGRRLLARCERAER